MRIGIRPSRVIGPADDPYMLRWHVLRLGRLPRIYVHNFRRSDDDRALHDHPWWFVSILVRGSYQELRPTGTWERRAPSIAFRRATDRHRVVLTDSRPWTIFITGPVVRQWGFWCPNWRIKSHRFAFGLTQDIMVPDGLRFVPGNTFDGCE